MRCTDKTQHTYHIDQRHGIPQTQLYVDTGETRGQDRAETISDEMTLGGCETPHLTGAK